MPAPTIDQVQTLILSTLGEPSTTDISNTRSLSLDGQNLDNDEAQLVVKSVLDSLGSKEMITFTQVTNSLTVLTEAGLKVLASHSPEYEIWQALPSEVSEGLPLADVQAKVGKDTWALGNGLAMKLKWVKVNQGKMHRAATEAPVDTTVVDLKAISGASIPAPADKVVKELIKRKLAASKKEISFKVARGPQFATTVAKLETDLTAEMIASGAWKDASFKKYNFAAEGTPTDGGSLHPLLKVREEFRNIFFEMGFEEMPTNRFVESAFWNFDAMFVPQQHPARELQDTFYIKDPAVAGSPPRDYLDCVSKTHAEGGFGSIGYRAPFSEDETNRLLLRTHTTAVSTAMLYKLANQPGGFKPAKYFSIDRVFRNEATDATHLAEFHQVEGVVADFDITLGDLIGFMEQFFAKMGIHNLRFKPAFNPYTEPSLEIFQYHPGLNKTIEIGNSGMFRPEMLEPMGLPKGVRVLGWGLSLERPTMIKYKIKDIRTLVGHKVDVEGVRQAAAVRLEKGVL